MALATCSCPGHNWGVKLVGVMVVDDRGSRLCTGDTGRGGGRILDGENSLGANRQGVQKFMTGSKEK